MFAAETWAAGNWIAAAVYFEDNEGVRGEVDKTCRERVGKLWPQPAQRARTAQGITSAERSGMGKVATQQHHGRQSLGWASQWAGNSERKRLSREEDPLVRGSLCDKEISDWVPAAEIAATVEEVDQAGVGWSKPPALGGDDQPGERRAGPTQRRADGLLQRGRARLRRMQEEPCPGAGQDRTGPDRAFGCSVEEFAAPTGMSSWPASRYITVAGAPRCYHDLIVVGRAGTQAGRGRRIPRLAPSFRSVCPCGCALRAVSRIFREPGAGSKGKLAHP
jgi:hypothetical protein